MCQQVLDSDGLLVGHSAGAALRAATAWRAARPRGVVVALLPDGGERYLSETPAR